jgi:hypothetical protein
MTEAEMIEAIRATIHLRTRYLRWARIRKTMTMEDVLLHHGVTAFAEEVAKHLVLSNTVLFKGPSPENHGSFLPKE